MKTKILMALAATIALTGTAFAQSQRRNDISPARLENKKTIETEDSGSTSSSTNNIKVSSAIDAAPALVGSRSTRQSSSSSSANDDKWHFRFSPYAWIAGVTGRAGIGALVVNVDSGLSDPNVHLNFGLMGAMEARKNKFIILTDLQYSNLGTERPNPGILFSSATADFKTFILDPEVGYRVAANPEKGRYVDVVGGVRYWHLRTDLNFAAGALSARSATASRGWVDGVGGVRGVIHLSPKIYMMGKGDLGAGGSKFTYQLFGGFGFQVSRSVALVGGYRAIHVNYDRNNFLFDTTLHGPILGLTIAGK